MLHEPIKPMLLYSSPTVPSGQYIYQLKFDGHRTLLHKEGENISMFTRQGTHCTAQYPEVAAGAAISADNVILDGEMIVMGADGKPCFDSLMERFSAKKSVNHLALKMPAHFVAFDILYVNGKDVTQLPIEKRLSLLEDVAAPSEAMSVCRSGNDGESLFEAVKTLGLEGIVSKKNTACIKWIRGAPHGSKRKITYMKRCRLRGFAKAENSAGYCNWTADISALWSLRRLRHAKRLRR